MKERDSRLFSLDALRGLDMLFLCVVQPIVAVAAKNFGFSDVETHPFMRQFGHFWGGFTAYDLIMPLFIFMSGAAVPLALKRRLDAEGRPTAAFWKHIGEPWGGIVIQLGVGAMLTFALAVWRGYKSGRCA